MRVSLKPEFTMYNSHSNHSSRIALPKRHVTPMDTVSFGMAFGDKRSVVTNDPLIFPERDFRENALKVESYVELRNINTSIIDVLERLTSSGTIEAEEINVGEDANLHDVVAKKLIVNQELASNGTIKAEEISVGEGANLLNVKANNLTVGTSLDSKGTIEAKKISVGEGANLLDVKADTLTVCKRLESSGTIEAKNIRIEHWANLLNVKANNLTVGQLLTSSGTIKAGTINVASNAKLHDVEGAKHLLVGTHLASNGTIKAETINVGSGASLNDVVAKKLIVNQELASTGTIEAEEIDVKHWAKFHDVKANTLNVGTKLESTGTVKAEIINSGDKTTLATIDAGSIVTNGRELKIKTVKHLEGIVFLLDEVKDNNVLQSERRLEISEFSNDGKPINLILDDFYSIVITTCEEAKDAVKRFNFIEAVIDNAEETEGLIVKIGRQFNPAEIADFIERGLIRFVQKAL